MPVIVSSVKIGIDQHQDLAITKARKILGVSSADVKKANIVKELGNARYTINRSKGLGENEPAMMWLTTMNPETRRLIKVLPENAEETARVFDLLLGDNLAGRKEHIAQVGSQYLDMADIS